MSVGHLDWALSIEIGRAFVLTGIRLKFVEVRFYIEADDIGISLVTICLHNGESITALDIRASCVVGATDWVSRRTPKNSEAKAFFIPLWPIDLSSQTPPIFNGSLTPLWEALTNAMLRICVSSHLYIFYSVL